MTLTALGTVRHDWTLPEVADLLGMPLMDPLYHAQRVHREHHEQIGRAHV